MTKLNKNSVNKVETKKVLTLEERKQLALKKTQENTRKVSTMTNKSIVIEYLLENECDRNLAKVYTTEMWFTRNNVTDEEMNKQWDKREVGMKNAIDTLVSNVQTGKIPTLKLITNGSSIKLERK